MGNEMNKYLDLSNKGLRDLIGKSFKAGYDAAIQAIPKNRFSTRYFYLRLHELLCSFNLDK